MLKIDTKGRKELFRVRTGSHNYNLNDETSDEDWKVFVLPTFNDLYDGVMYSSPTNTSEELDYSVKDIRFFGKQVYKANISFLELLYSDKIIINPYLEEDTKKLVNRMFEMRDRLIRVNLPKLYDANIGMYKQRIKNMSKGSISTKHLVDKYGYCTKNAMHAQRYLDFLYRFGMTDDFEIALKYSNGRDRDRLLGFKMGTMGTKEEVEESLSRSFRIVEMACEKVFKSQPTDTDTIDELNEIIKEMVKASWR